MKRTYGLMGLAGLLCLCTGCVHPCNRQPNSAPRGAVFVPPAPVPGPLLAPPPPGALVQPPPSRVIAPQGSFPTAPPGPVVQPPPSGAIAPQGGFPTAPPGPGSPPPSIAPLGPNAAPPARYEPQLKQTDSRAPAPSSEKPRIQLYAPEALDKDKTKPTEEPSVDKKLAPQTALPAIPQFAKVKENVYSGLPPKLDGLDWLQAKGVQTIIHIRAPGAGDSGDRVQAEKRKLTYIPFVVSPQTLTKEKVDEFVKLIRERAPQGVFVYDEDGSLAGAMWYLFFRVGDVLDDDATGLRIRDLGLEINVAGPEREMWLAAKKLLSESSR